MTAQTTQSTVKSWAYRVGYYAALVTTAGGILYFLAILGAVFTGRFTFPPGEGLQLFGGITTLIFSPAIVLMMTSLNAITPAHRKVMSQASLGFTLLFALAVSINRFSQLGVVRQAEAAGKIEGISWFQAYGSYSVMLGLEYLGWTWFLGLAMLCAAPLFSAGKLAGWIRWSMVLYGILSLLAMIGFLLGSWLSLLGFAAWGVVLFVISGLLAAYFRWAEAQV